jgi:nucleoside-diphosphate-sugar epimerase
MSHVLVTGATTAVGRFLLPRLEAAGYQVTALGRNIPDGEAAGRWRRCDLTDPGAVAALPEAEGLIHVAPLWLLPPLLRPLRQAGVRRIVAFSSTSVHTKMGSASRRERALVRSLLDSEHQVLNAGGFARTTILRPTLIYGGGLDRNISAIARWIDRHGFFPVEGGGRGLRQPVHADDLAWVGVRLLAQDVEMRGAVEVGGEEALPYREMVERIFAALERPPRILSVPRPALQWALRIAGIHPRFHGWTPAMVARMNQDMAFASLTARATLGYAPRPFHPTREDLDL